MKADLHLKDRILFSVFFFVVALAIACWFVPFSSVLQAHGFEWLTPYALASTAVAAFISPMITGSLADRSYSATKLLRLLCLGTATMISLTFLAIHNYWHYGLILGLFQIQQLCSAPIFGLVSMIVLASLPMPERQFGSLRVWATFGWIAACLLVSFGLKADSSTLTGFVSAAFWILSTALTFLLPEIQPGAPGPRRNCKELLGLDALGLLHDTRHRSVFLTAGLLSIPMAAFYPFAALQLRDLGFLSVSASMSLGQVSEAAAMYALSPLLARFSLKTLCLSAISASALRYFLFANNHEVTVLTGVFLHGICFTLFFIPAQIYIEKHIDHSMRFRAQSLMNLFIGGIGNLLGYLGCGWLRVAFSHNGHTNWTAYWLTLNLAVFAVGFYFLRTHPASQNESEDSFSRGNEA